ncbi:MAG TPA: hypothetical protein VN927_00305 [Gemmatimonadaceae bacterium]|nr:hypothetical protein [Gemmatimonadaceae bacterium]
MGWTDFTDTQTGDAWQINQECLFLLVRSNLRANSIRARTAIEVTPGGLLSPTTSLVGTDWSGFRFDLETKTQALYNETNDRIVADGVTNMPENLAFLRTEAIAKAKEVEDMQRKAQKDTFDSIDSTVDGLETAKTVAEFTRDISATILVSTATVLSGGTALAVLGAGAGIKGAAKFQDTGNVGLAVVEATGTFVVGALPIKAPGVDISSADAKVLVFVGAAMDGTFEGVKAMVDGQSASTAIEQAAARAGGSALLGMAGLKMEKLPVFVSVSANVLGTMGLDRTVNAIAPQKVMQKPPTSGKIDFSTAITGGGKITSQDFVRQFVLRRAIVN